MEGVGLDDAGRSQARRLAERLRHEAIAALYVSPLQRAIETAEPLASTLNLSATPNEALNEIDMGDWTGTTFEALQRRPDWSRRQADALAQAPGGESLKAVQARSVRWMKDMLTRHPETGVAAVCHADVIKAALCHAMGLALDNHRRLEISPGSISLILADRTGFRVRSINEIPH